jgi:RNA polymerase sigma-70 factor (ECF subfamily)
LKDFFTIACNIILSCAIITATMVGAMVKVIERNEDDLVLKAHTQAEALSRLYEMYYERIFRFCVHRLFDKEIAEDVTSTVFLEVARSIRLFKGRTLQDFQNWLYAITANQTNACIRKTSRRKELLKEAAGLIPAADGGNDESSEPDWPRLYAAILKLKPRHQTIVTLRFFENLKYEQIAQILNIKEVTVRVTLHRILNELRKNLQSVFERQT